LLYIVIQLIFELFVVLPVIFWPFVQQFAPILSFVLIIFALPVVIAPFSGHATTS